MYACLHQSGSNPATLVELARAFSPAIEVTGENTVLFSIDGLGRLMGGPDQIASEIARRGAGQGLIASLAIAASPDTAVLAAEHLPGVTLIPPGKEAEWLGRIPLEQLTLENGLRETLDRWGLKKLADLAELPPIGLAERLGEEGVRLYNLALGLLDRPLKLEPPATRYTESLDLEDPVANLEPLLFLLARLLNELCRRLQTHTRATNRITTELALDNGTRHQRILELPVPQNDPAPLLKLLQLDLEAHPPVAAIKSLSISLHPVRPKAQQGGLFLPPAPAPDKLQLTLARIEALVGEGNVGSPTLLDTHRPDAFEMHPYPVTGYRVPRRAPSALRGDAQSGDWLPCPKARPSRRVDMDSLSPDCPVNASPRVQAALRFYRPPLGARVRLRERVPQKVMAAGVAGNVVDAAGPWRTSGDWWRPTVWSRDEWDLALTDGGVYRVFCQLRSQDWFVEGVYD